ncbi:pilus assembly protein PilO [Chlorogloea sp. CCALA 695]|uniref:pilus assembly protein PilO n=1 Tax=Chlorogloea sp. CCALA 695 TaxID=2107693 RepID=UPI000D05E397|nr:pilus assembly protein PilO [Chlorogloea sp. CCALA 695]PSB32872.1 pilus assembly protein PilO [Chlorogloea sp. CCALA 695]
MTFSDDFITVGEGQELQGSPDNSPSLFGIKLTPQVSGILIAVALLALAAYLANSYVTPLWQKYGELTADRDLKQSQVSQKQANIKQGEELKKDLDTAKKNQTEILSLFANEKTLDTLLLDINRLVDSGNSTTGGAVAKLQKFEPVNQSAEIINDGSFGSEVNGKLKRRIINISLAGNYEQTQSIFRNMERLQPLLIVNEYTSTLQQDPVDPTTGRLPPASINTAFKLQALIPATPEETAAAAAAAAPKQ